MHTLGTLQRACRYGLLAALWLCAMLAFGADNLVVNPGFEQPAVTDPVQGWAFVSHGQQLIRGEMVAQDWHAGLQSASIVAPETPKTYACWAQQVHVAGDGVLPNTFSVWYRSPAQDSQVSFSYTANEDGKSVAKGTAAFTLPASRDWRQFTTDLRPPAGTRDILLELRANKKGAVLFDDVVLVRDEQPANGIPNALLFVGILRDQLPALWQEPLAKAGFARQIFAEWEQLTPAMVKQSRAVVLVNLPFRQYVTPQDEAISDMLFDYMKAGGGVLVTQRFEQIRSELTLSMYLAERLGTRILLEKVVAPKEAIKKVGPWDPDIFTYTTQVGAPWTTGITGVWYPAVNDLGVYAGMLPFLPVAPWQVTLSSGPGVKSDIYLTGLDEIDRTARAEGFAADVPLAGCREFERGRAAYIGCDTSNIFARPIATAEDANTYAAYMRDGIDGRPSGLLQFYINAFTWLGEHADALAAVKLTLHPTPPSPFTTAWKSQRGIIGPRTRYSSGASTPDEYIARAKAAGLDYIVFLEDFAALKPGAFEQLKADCRRITASGFVAVPGITYQNDQGNHEYIFSDTLLLPSKRYLDPTGSRIKTYYPDNTTGGMTDLSWWYSLLSFGNNSGWYDFRENPYPFYDTRDVDTIAVVLQEHGKTLERLPAAHGYQARSGQFTWPLALNLMTDAAEINGVKDGSAYVNVVGAEGSKQLYDILCTGLGRSMHLYPGMTSFGGMYLTNGPQIDLAMPRGDTDAAGNPYNPNLQEWALTLKVSSPAGVREVKLYDGDTVIRRLLPGGVKEYTYTTSIPKERQRAIWVLATDNKGKEAIGRDIPCNSWLLRENQCGDRNNQLLDSRQLRPDGSPFFVGYGGDTTMPDKGPWNGRIRAVGCFVFDKKLGVGSTPYDGSPENHPTPAVTPYLVMDGKMPPSVGWVRALVADKEGGPHVEPHRVVASSDVLVADRILDGVYPKDAQPVTLVWHTMYPVKPSAYLKTTGRAYLYRIKPDGISAYLWNQDFTFLQDIPVKADGHYAVGVCGFYTSTATQFILANNGTVIEQGTPKAHPVQVHPFNTGDYVGLLKSPFGSLAVFSLIDGLVVETDGMGYQVGIKPAQTVLKAGSTLRANLLFVGMHREVADPAALAAGIRQSYGLVGKPGYTAEVTHGTILDQQYVLSVKTDEGGDFQATLHGLAALAGNLGSMVHGLHDNWTAAFQQCSDHMVKTRLVPVEQGIGYALWQAEDDGKLVTIGHPIVASNPAVSLTLTRSADWKSWQLEIHNPTDKALTVTIRNNPAFTGFTINQTLKLRPGSSVMRKLGAVAKE